MKMLNAIDDATLADTPADAAVLREGFGLLLRTLYPAAPHVTFGCGPNWVLPRRMAS
jgi:leucyl-tRNA synthetase